jgi:hypothetical protein
MPATAPELHEGKDGQRELIKRVNWLLRQFPISNGQLFSVNGISIGGSSLLTTTDAANFGEGTIVFVETVGDYFGLQQSALTVDGITVIDALNKAGYQWKRLGITNLGWAAQYTWYVDPTAGNDEHSGSTELLALASWRELARRWVGAYIRANASVTLLGDSSSADTTSFNLTIAPNVSITISGTLGPTVTASGTVDNTLFTGAVTTTQAAPTAPSTNDTHFSDSSIPASFTASGLLAVGTMFKRTNGTVAEWWPLKDLGSKTLRITPPADVNGSNAALSVADTYSVYRLWNVYDLDFGVDAQQVILKFVTDRSTGIARQQVGAPRLAQVWETATGIKLINGGPSGGAVTNVLFAPTGGALQFHSSPGIPTQIKGGGFLGSTLSTFGAWGIGGGAWASQGMSFQPNDYSYMTIESPGGFYDCSVGLFVETDHSTVAVNISNPSGGGISGSGNSSWLVFLNDGSRFSYGVNAATPPFVAGSTSLGSPIHVAGVDYLVTDLPVNDFSSGEGVFNAI